MEAIRVAAKTRAKHYEAADLDPHGYEAADTLADAAELSHDEVGACAWR